MSYTLLLSVRMTCRGLLPCALLFWAALSTSAQYTTAYGVGALANNSAATNENTAFGYYVLYSNTTGNQNTATGFEALYNTTTGNQNTADGVYALFSNTTGNQNTATGCSALANNTTGTYNTATGFDALADNSTGIYFSDDTETAVIYTSTGNQNTADGGYALFHNTTGTYNTVNGYAALFSNTIGDYNTASGVNTLYSATTGSNNIALGYNAGYYIATGSNNIAIGNVGTAPDSGVIRIGTTGTHTATYIAGISGVASPRGLAVYIDSQGQLGTFTSSRRYKRDIHDLGTISSRLMALRPVSFRYKKAAEDGSHPVQYGLIAEEVAKICPELVAYDRTGKPMSVYYHLLTPMLLNELQKEHRRSEEQHKQIAVMQAAHTAQTHKIADLEAMVQRQNAQLAALTQAQQQQLKALKELAAALPASQTGASQRRMALLQR